MKKFTEMAKNRKTKLAVGGIVLLVAAAGFSLWWMNGKTTETAFYDALAQDIGTSITGAETIDQEGVKAEFYSNLSDDKGFRAEGVLTCTADSVVGNIKLVTSFRQIDDRLYMRDDEISVNHPDDPSIAAAVDSVIAGKIGKWYLTDAPDDILRGYIEQGVLFSVLGAHTKDMSAREVANLLKEHKVTEIRNVRETTKDGRDVTEYSVLVRRSAYEGFIDSVKADFKYKDGVLDGLFTDDEEEITLVVDKQDPAGRSYARYTMPNLCASLVSEFDADAAAELPTQLRVDSRMSDRNMDAVVVPEGFITQGEYDAQFAE